MIADCSSLSFALMTVVRCARSFGPSLLKMRGVFLFVDIIEERTTFLAGPHSVTPPNAGSGNARATCTITAGQMQLEELNVCETWLQGGALVEY